tara:strand:+ start:647 stop:802 length:156 start_codon:yes stop_codon:yes gene_type:complete
MIRRFRIESKLVLLGVPKRSEEMLLPGHPDAEMGRKSDNFEDSLNPYVLGS